MAEEVARALALLTHTLLFTLWQALLSAGSAVLIGLFAAPGFSRLRRGRKFVRAFLLFPNLLSPVLVVLGILVSFKNFPYGLGGIVAGHVFMNTGLATVWLGEKWRELETRFAPANQVLGGRPLPFYRRIILPQLKSQMLSAFAVIFTLCLSSFAIPLVLGGSPRNSTLEVLLYEKLRGEGDIRAAVFIALLQAFIQVVVFISLLKPESFFTKLSRPLTLLPQISLWSAVTAGVLFISIFPLIEILQIGVSQAGQLHALVHQSEFRNALGFSVGVAIGVAALVFIFLSLFLTGGWPAWLTRIPSVSGVVIGLGLLLGSLFLPRTQSPFVFAALLITGHFLVIFFPILRLAQNRLLAVRRNFSQVVAQLNISQWLAFKKVYLSLAGNILFSSAALAGLWSLGEFSVSRLISGQWITFPVLIENLISGYRLEAASAVSLLFLGISLFSLILIEGVIHGLD